MSHTCDNLTWFGTVPAHWKILKLRQILSPISEKNHPDFPLLSVVREKGVIIRNVEDKEENHNYVPDDLSGYKLVKCGQLAMNKMKAWQGSYGVSRFNGIVSPAYFVFDILCDINEDFFDRAIRSMVYINYFGRASDGIRVGQWDLSMQRMKEIPFLLPPRDEQEQIVRFLDWKVSSINRLINIKCRKIKELNALKKAIVNSAVKHGLTPNAPMKSSGVKWLGDIPAHWQISRIKRHFTLQDERNVKKLSDVNLLSVFSSVGVIPRSEVDDYSSGNKAANADGYKIVHCGDIVVNIILCWMGALGKSDFDGVTSPAYDVYKPDETVSSKYYHYLFRAKAFTEECYKVGRGIMSMRWRVYSQQFMNINIPIPPNEEQQKIVEYLDRKCIQIDASIGQIEESIAALQELKKCLVSDIVTGKIDVRGIEIPEYEFVDEGPNTEDSKEAEGQEEFFDE